MIRFSSCPLGPSASLSQGLSLPSHLLIRSSLPCLFLLPVGLSPFSLVLPKDVLVSSIGMEAWTFKNIFTTKWKMPMWDVAVLILNPHPWIDPINQTKRLRSFSCIFICINMDNRGHTAGCEVMNNVHSWMNNEKLERREMWLSLFDSLSTTN